MRPVRTDWNNFPDVDIVHTTGTISSHHAYAAAKKGSLESALMLVDDFLDVEYLQLLNHRFQQSQPDYIVAVHAEERSGRNKIPIAFGLFLEANLNVPLDTEIVQADRAFRTGADGYARLVKKVRFDGAVYSSAKYFIIDDAITQGGTIADLRGYLVSQGGVVVGASALMGKPHSARLSITKPTLGQLRKAAGRLLEEWWHEQFGYDFARLTESEARYIAKQLHRVGIDGVRDRLATARQASGNR